MKKELQQELRNLKAEQARLDSQQTNIQKRIKELQSALSSEFVGKCYFNGSNLYCKVTEYVDNLLWYKEANMEELSLNTHCDNRHSFELMYNVPIAKAVYIDAVNTITKHFKD